MKIKSFIVTLIIFCHSLAFANAEKTTVSPFLGAGFGVGNHTITAYYPESLFLTESENSQSFANIFGEIGFKINIKNFFIAPRFGLYSQNRNFEVLTFNGNRIAFAGSSTIDMDLMFGMYYKQTSFYFFFGKSRMNYENAGSRQELKIKQVVFGIGFEYYIIKQVGLFAEFAGYYADRDSITIKINGTELDENQKRLFDANFYSTKLKLGIRLHPIG